MRIDNYTRLLLTVITLCLVYLCAKDFLVAPKVQAEETVRVLLVDSNDRPVAGLGLAFPIKVEVREH